MSDASAQQMEDQRRWEDLKLDCLVNVLKNVGMESLLLDVPFVCKSWNKASLDPSCWTDLIFPEFEPDGPFDMEPYPIYDRFVSEYRVDENSFSVTAFIKFVINRSRGNAISLKLPGCCTVEAFEYAAEVCPGLGILGLPSLLLYSGINLDLIGKWKNLVMLSLGCCHELEKILAVISMHCNNFFHLTLSSNANIGKDEALAIVNLVPNIKGLSLKGARIDKDNLVILLQGCKDLQFLDVRNCIGFKEDDEEISQLGSSIRKFMCEGSKERFEFPFNLQDFVLSEEDIKNLAAMLAEIETDEEVDEEGGEQSGI